MKIQLFFYHLFSSLFIDHFVSQTYIHTKHRLKIIAVFCIPEGNHDRIFPCQFDGNAVIHTGRPFTLLFKSVLCKIADRHLRDYFLYRLFFKENDPFSLINIVFRVPSPHQSIESNSNILLLLIRTIQNTDMPEISAFYDKNIEKRAAISTIEEMLLPVRSYNVLRTGSKKLPTKLERKRNLVNLIVVRETVEIVHEHVENRHDFDFFLEMRNGFRRNGKQNSEPHCNKNDSERNDHEKDSDEDTNDEKKSRFFRVCPD